MFQWRTSLLHFRTLFKWLDMHAAHLHSSSFGAGCTMALKVSQTQLPQLLSWLEQYLPTSFKLHEDLKSHLKGRFPDLVFFVDRWPDPQAVSAVVDPDGQQLQSTEFYNNINLGVFGVNDDALKSLLQEKEVVDWNKATVFCCVADILWAPLMSLIEEMVGPVQPEPVLLLKATKQDLKPVPMPEGMNISPVTKDLVRVVDSTWKFKCDGSEHFISDLIRYNPSVFLTTKDGEHVGHMLGQSYGTMGMLYVQPHFRRKGYAKVIISQLAEKYFEEQDEVRVMIEEDNDVSLNLHHSLGFNTVPNLKIAWMKTTPKKCKPQSAKCCV